MSKIYESLLRAELDRLQTGQTSAERQEPATPAAKPDSSAAGELPAAASSAPEATPQDGAAASEGFPWHKIAVRSWHLSLSQLPSLDRTSPAAEQFRSLRARLYEYRDFNKLKTVLVCSGLPQEGKSFVAANLAVTLAHQRNSRVLLVDADLRRYSLDKVLGCELTPGLADYLSGKAQAVDIMQRAVAPENGESRQTLSLANLTFIPAGDGGDLVVDLSANGRFKQLLQDVQSAFDWIVVDSSPVNLVSDAVHFAHDCDGVLLVVRSGVTRYETAQHAQAEFKSVSVIGAVLNGSTDALSPGYYGYGAESAGR